MNTYTKSINALIAEKLGWEHQLAEVDTGWMYTEIDEQWMWQKPDGSYIKNLPDWENDIETVFRDIVPKHWELLFHFHDHYKQWCCIIHDQYEGKEYHGLGDTQSEACWDSITVKLL